MVYHLWNKSCFVFMIKARGDGYGSIKEKTSGSNLSTLWIGWQDGC